MDPTKLFWIKFYVARYQVTSRTMQRRTYLEAVAGAAGIGAITTGVGARGSVPGEGRGPPDETPPTTPVLDEDSRAELTAFVEEHVADGSFPGAAISVINENGRIYDAVVGDAEVEPERRELTADTAFDLASVTKVVATTTSIMQLVERGDLTLDDTLSDVYPDLPEEKRDVTIRHLLTHTSGLQAWQPLWHEVDDPDDVVDYILYDTEMAYEPGSEYVYSDLGFVVLKDVVQQVTGTPLDEYAAANVFEPLGMDTTAYNPGENLPDDVEYAATENYVGSEPYDDCTVPSRRCRYYGEELVVGEVHDSNTAFMGGVSGHAGLFTTLDDLTTFASAILNGGAYRGTRILSEATVDTITENWTPDVGARRGLGWDLQELFGEAEDGSSVDPGTFGHMGFTGPSIWFAPDLGVGVVVLTNRVHPTRVNYGIYDFRPEFHNRVATSLTERRGRGHGSGRNHDRGA